MKFLSIFEEGVEEPTQGSSGWYNSWCPFHENPKEGHKTPSFGFNPVTGSWRCHGCGKSGGPADFLGEIRISGYNSENKAHLAESLDMLGKKVPEIKKRTKKMTKKPDSKAPLPDYEQIEKWHSELLSHSEALNHAINSRMWSKPVIDDLRIGIQLVMGGFRFTIPVTISGDIVNVRKYNTEMSPKIMGIRGHNSTNYFPEKALDYERVYIVEGEPDCLAARSAGLNAMTFTGGAGNVPSDIHRIKDHKVVIIYDSDEAGIKGAKRVSQSILKYTRQVKILDITKSSSTSNDITDAITDIGHIEFLKSIREQESDASIKEESILDSVVKKEVGFNEAISSGHIGYKIDIVAMILGRRERPYSAISRIATKCMKVGSRGECTICPLASGKANHPVSPNDRIGERDLLRQIKVADPAKRAVLRELGGYMCDEWELDEYNSRIESLFEIIIGPYTDANGGSADSEHIGFAQRTAFAIDEGSGHSINQPYRFVGVTVAQPWDQSNTHVFTKCSEIQRTVDCFDLDGDQIKRLEIFKP